MSHIETTFATPAFAVEVVEAEHRNPIRRIGCRIGENVAFSTKRLQSYCFASWEPVIYDALLVAAAVEFSDRVRRRSALKWNRDIELRVPVHEPDRWRQKSVSESLHSALNFLTGDRWQIDFGPRRTRANEPEQCPFDLPPGITAVIPFSEGLDSCAVGGLMEKELGSKLIRVRLGSKLYKRLPTGARRQPFTSIPYRVRSGSRNFPESSARSRGFKFALISGLASYLAKAQHIIVPESGQGALGPALVTVGQAYQDYRSHPLFTTRMERFLHSLLGHNVRFQFPQLWHTKAETLKQYLSACNDSEHWAETWSCWQQNRQVSVDEKKRQCGICAACMLRRMSVHAAGLTEDPSRYVWENLSLADFKSAAAPSFEENKITGKMRDYAIAGTLHLDHLAGFSHSPAGLQSIALTAFQLSQVLELSKTEAREKLNRLLTQHSKEWKNYVDSLGSNSFVAQWATEAGL
jgi:7-cyano-7-deazaguanine synthase in queuosine biosynthesis